MNTAAETLCSSGTPWLTPTCRAHSLGTPHTFSLLQPPTSWPLRMSYQQRWPILISCSKYPHRCQTKERGRDPIDPWGLRPAANGGVTLMNINQAAINMHATPPGHPTWRDRVAPAFRSGCHQTAADLLSTTKKILKKVSKISMFFATAMCAPRLCASGSVRTCLCAFGVPWCVVWSGISARVGVCLCRCAVRLERKKWHILMWPNLPEIPPEDATNTQQPKQLKVHLFQPGNKTPPDWSGGKGTDVDGVSTEPTCRGTALLWAKTEAYRDRPTCMATTYLRTHVHTLTDAVTPASPLWCLSLCYQAHMQSSQAVT